MKKTKKEKKSKKSLKIFFGVIVVLVLAYTVCALLPKQQNYTCDNPLLKGEGELPDLIAHRGGDEEFPGNTLEAFYNAYSINPDVIMETDVNITKDGVLILLHNTQLDRTTNVTGLASDWNYTDLVAQRVDFGYENPTSDGWLDGEREHFNVDGVNKYPTDVAYPDGVSPRDDEVFLVTTLEELIVAFPNSRISVEIKQDGELGLKAVKEAVRILTKHDAFDRVNLASTHTEIYDEYQRMAKAGEVPETFMYSPGLMGVAKFYALHILGLDSLFFDGIAVLQIPDEQYGLNFATAELIKTAHEHNVAVQYWTINDEEDMRFLISIGADGIMTDCPSKLQAIYDEMSK